MFQVTQTNKDRVFNGLYSRPNNQKPESDETLAESTYLKERSNKMAVTWQWLLPVELWQRNTRTGQECKCRCEEMSSSRTMVSAARCKASHQTGLDFRLCKTDPEIVSSCSFLELWLSLCFSHISDLVHSARIEAEHNRRFPLLCARLQGKRRKTSAKWPGLLTESRVIVLMYDVIVLLLEELGTQFASEQSPANPSLICLLSTKQMLSVYLAFSILTILPSS